jgi:hypothetical protein
MANETVRLHPPLGKEAAARCRKQRELDDAKLDALPPSSPAVGQAWYRSNILSPCSLTGEPEK